MESHADYNKLATVIVRHQEFIVGPLAWSQAEKVSGLEIKEKSVVVKGDGKSVLQDLVKKYEELFGPASVEVCKDAVRPLLGGIKKDEIPPILQ